MEPEGIALGFAACVAQRSKNPHEGEHPNGVMLVEPEGIEPSSKQGSPELSTRLSQPEFSCIGKTWATNLCLIPYGFHPPCGAATDYLRFSCATLPGRFGARAPE